ncbi:hypothetical protein Plhal304r1_c011g0041891 [Plasmopara halstedii]
MELYVFKECNYSSVPIAIRTDAVSVSAFSVPPRTIIFSRQSQFYLIVPCYKF